MDKYRKQLASIITRVIALKPEQLDELNELLVRLADCQTDGIKLQEFAVSPPQMARQATQENAETLLPNQQDTAPSTTKDWPRSPIHRLEGNGTFIVTSGTLGKEHYFRDAEALSFLEDELLRIAKKYGWHLEAWAVFSNHYHFVGYTLGDANSLREFIGALHTKTSEFANRRDGTPRRQVWHNYWETKLTFQTAYQARLKYVHYNAVKHGLVAVPNQYPWCSAAWFERTATVAQVKTIYSFKIDKVKVLDDYAPMPIQ